MAELESTRGRLLVATPLLGDPNFERTVIFVLEDNEEGALGLVLNRPSPLEVTEPLPDWSRLVATPSVVFVGGPVSRTSVIALAAASRPTSYRTTRGPRSKGPWASST